MSFLDKLGNMRTGPLSPFTYNQVGRGIKRAFVAPEQEKTFDKFTPDQQGLLSQLLAALTGQGQGPQGGLLGDLFGEKGFESFAAPARREFEEKTIPTLAQKFASTGGSSLVNSSAFQQQLARAGEDLSTKLGEDRSKQQMNSIQSLLNQLMQPQFERYYQPSGPGFIPNLLNAFAGGAGKVAGAAAMGA